MSQAAAGDSPDTPPPAPGSSQRPQEAQKAPLTLAQLHGENARLHATLAEANQALATAEAELNRLRFSVSHDLRAPLRHVGAFAQVIEEDFGSQLDAQVMAHLKTIQTAAAEMGQMLDLILESNRTS